MKVGTKSVVFGGWEGGQLRAELLNPGHRRRFADIGAKRRKLPMATANVNTFGRWDPQSARAAPELMTARELEAMLKIDVKTIYSYVQRGLIPYVKIQSNVRFPKEEILSWVEERSHRPRLARGNGSIRP